MTKTPPLTPPRGNKESALRLLKTKHSVIPVGKDKIPLVKWQEFQNRLATENEVNDWFDKYPEANVGIITGKISNLVVVDVESGGDIKRFPETLTIRTGGGGWHLYYRYYPIANKTRIFPLTDIRGDGGYVVAPGSTHASGNKYEILTKDFIAPFPFEMFGEKKQSKVLEVSSGVEKGQRNQSASTMAGALLRAFSRQKETAWKLLKDWNDKNIPPLTDYELRNVFNSIAGREDKKFLDFPILESEALDKVDFLTYTELLNQSRKERREVDPKSIVSFGYDWLDQRLTGLFPGELVVLGGESGTGKTTFATNIIYRASKKFKCCVFALEDRLNDYGMKAFYFEIGKIRKERGLPNYPWNDYRRNEIKDEKYQQYEDQAFENLRSESIHFADVKRQLDIGLLERKIEEKAKEGFKLFLVDHLHTFDMQRGMDTKADFIEKMMVRIKTLLNRCGVAMILIVHYKKLEGRKPSMDSFKDSISIPQNANYTLNLWRNRSDDKDVNRYETQLMIPKSRNPNGEFTLTLEFDPLTYDYRFIGEKFGTEIKKQENEFGF